MKKAIGLLITLLFLSVSSLAKADPAKWDGFRGIKWATNIKDLNDPNMVLVDDVNEYKGYRRLNDKLSIGDANLKEIFYTFYKDRLYGVRIEARGEDNFRLLKDAVFAYYGSGMRADKPSNSWLWSPVLNNSGNVTMVFMYDENTGVTNWVMSYIPILKEISDEKARKAKDAGKGS